MGAAVLLRTVIGKAQHRLLVGIVPLHRHIEGDAVLLTTAEKYVRMQHVLGPVHVLDEALHAAREREVLFLARALVDEDDLDAVVEERKLAQTPRQDVVVVVHAPERLLGSEEVHFGAASLARTDKLERSGGGAVAKLHLVHLAIPP